METTDLTVIKGKIVSSVVALTSRTFVLQGVSLGSMFILSILLSPSMFGVFSIVTAVISFLSYFSDIGLAATLIQMKEEPSREELKTTFTIQFFLVSMIILIIYTLTSFLASFYTLDADGIFLLHALLLSFFLSSLKTIPSILIERKLEFKLLVIPQILETVVFYLITILLAFMDYGVASFAWGALARGIVGVIAIYIISPWRIGIGISTSVIRKLLSFGIPFQLNSILALIKDDLLILFLGKVLPLADVGYINWAKKWGEAPLRLIMDNIIRVTFPAFSRIQSDKELLRKAIEKSLFFLSLFILPMTVFLIFYIEPLVQIVPRYAKWQPAVMSFYFFSFSALLASFSSPITNALNAIGKIRITLVLMVIWTTLTWAFVPLFVTQFGFSGVSYASFLISFTAILPILLLRRVVYFNILQPLLKPFVSTGAILIVLFLFSPILTTLPGIILSFVCCAIIYILFISLWMKQEILPYLPRFKKNIS